MYRKIAAAAATLTAVITIGGPAFAALNGPGVHEGPPSGTAPTGAGPTTTVRLGDGPKPPTGDAPKPATSEPPRPTTTTTVKTAEPPKPPTGDGPKPPTTTEPKRDLEQLRLACTGARVEGVGAVRCEWSPSASPAFTHYMLFSQGPGRAKLVLIFRTTDRGTTSFVDKPLAPGTYKYKLFAMTGGPEGSATPSQPVGTSPIVEANVPAPPPEPKPVEPKPATFALDCRPVAGPKVTCTWPASTSERFAGYRLFREAPGSSAVVRFTTSDRNVTTANDDGVQPGSTYKYRVVVVDGTGKVIAYGGPVTVTIPPAGTGDAPVT
jgi:hypothetical protein